MKIVGKEHYILLKCVLSFHQLRACTNCSGKDTQVELLTTIQGSSKPLVTPVPEGIMLSLDFHRFMYSCLLPYSWLTFIYKIKII